MKFPGKMVPEVFKTAVKPPVTSRYPFEKAEVPEDFRGKIHFNSQQCIGCKMCMRDCPAKAITIEKVGEEKVFKAVFDLDRCIFCAQFVDNCPRKALSSTPQFELASYKRDDLKDTQE